MNSSLIFVSSYLFFLLCLASSKRGRTYIVETKPKIEKSHDEKVPLVEEKASLKLKERLEGSKGGYVQDRKRGEDYFWSTIKKAASNVANTAKQSVSELVSAAKFVGKIPGEVWDTATGYYDFVHDFPYTNKSQTSSGKDQNSGQEEEDHNSGPAPPGCGVKNRDCYQCDASAYNGYVSKTESGRVCQSWMVESPHRHGYVEYPYSLGYNIRGGHNYCRNPDPGAVDRPWCYTTDKNKRWEHCNVEKCKPDESCKRESDGYKNGKVKAGVINVDCQTGIGKDYRGWKQTTKCGIKCQRWDDGRPHKHGKGFAGQYGIPHMKHNLCRNPDPHNAEEGVWCYTTQRATRWEYCGVRQCTESDTVEANLEDVDDHADQKFARLEKYGWFGQCVVDHPPLHGDKRLLPDLAIARSNGRLQKVSQTECIAKTCRRKGYRFAGLQNGGECWCGNTPPPRKTFKPWSECNKPCNGNSIQKCGGKRRMNVYTTFYRFKEKAELGIGPRLKVAYMRDEEFPITQNNQVYALVSLGKQYNISCQFYISYGSRPVQYNIFHITGGDNSGYKNRVPAVWLTDSDRNQRKLLHVFAPISGISQNRILTHHTLAIRKWINLEISQIFENSKYIFRVKIDGKTAWKEENKKPEKFDNLALYTADGWYPPMKGKLRHFMIETTND